MHFRNRLRRYLFPIFLLSCLIYVCLVIHQYKISIKEGWDYSTSRNASDYVYPNLSTTLIKPSGFCQSTNYLLVIVCSAPHHFRERLAIRESWGLNKTISNMTVGVYFLLGQTVDFIVQKKLENESDKYEDIIQETFIDTYNNLTLKSLMLLKLVKDNCRANVKYAMKVDDDIFVNLVPLIKTLLDLKSSTRVLFGRLICNSKPIRDVYDKWYAPEYMYQEDAYPNYLSGTGYVMSIDVPEILFNQALKTPLLHLEDVYVTGICATFVNLKATQNLNFSYKMVPFDPCTYRTLITSHYFNPTDMKLMHTKVHNSDLDYLCKLKKEKNYNETEPVLKLYRPVPKEIYPSKNTCV